MHRMQFVERYVVTTPKHATEIPACSLLVRNIIDFMRDIGGGAVLVTLTPPRGRERYPKYKISRLMNGPSIARDVGWKVRDYTEGRFPLTDVSGRLVTNSQLAADQEASRAAAKARRAAKKSAPPKRRAKKGA